MELVVIVHIIILLLLVVTAIAALIMKDLLDAVIIYSIYSFSMSITYLILRSADVAMTEAAIGAGVTTILFIAALSKTTRREE